MPQLLEDRCDLNNVRENVVENAHPVPASGRLVAIDVLRAVAALIILLRHGYWAHLIDRFSELGLFWITFPFTLGAPGVSLLLVVSGFCIHARAARSDPNRPPLFGLFWKRRLRRLYPPYVAAILLSAGVLVFISAGRLATAGAQVDSASILSAIAPEGTPHLIRATLAHLFFLFPLWHKAVWAFGNPVFWTLALEICLYLAYFGVPKLRKRLGMEGTVLLVLAVSILWRLGSTYGPIDFAGPNRSLHSVPDFPQSGWQLTIVGLSQMPARWFEWMLGALAAEVVFGTSRSRAIYRSIPLAVLAFTAAVVCQWFRLGNVFTDLCWGISSFVLLIRLIEAERNTPIRQHRGFQSLAWIGSWSYSLYLIHVPLLTLAHFVILPYVGGVVGLSLCLIFSFAASYPFYRFIEVPALSWSRAAVKRHLPDSVAPKLCLAED